MLIRPRHNFTTSTLLVLVLASICSLIELKAVNSQQSQRPAAPRPAQQSEQQDQRPTDPVARIATELVQIDVVVTSREGKLVGDLKREDFQVFEDGKPQQISHFAVGNSTQPALWLDTEKRRRAASKNAPRETETPTESHGRFIVMAVDDLHMSASSLFYAKKAMQKFVRDQLAGGDQTAIATTSGSLGLLQQFTTDRTVLSRAIDRLRIQQTAGMTPLFDIPQMSDYQAELIDLGDPEALELAVQEILRTEMPTPPPPPAAGRGGPAGGGGGGGEISAREQAIARAKGKARMMVAENAHFTTWTLSSLESTVRTLRNLPGRKIVILVSDGFFLGGSSNNKQFDIRRITDAATRSGVVIYSMDARGLIATPPGGDASTPSQIDVGMPGVRSRIEHGSENAKRDGLNALARDTGGFLVLNTNDLNSGIKKVLDENETYYVVAWEPESSYRDGRFRKIEVKLPDRPELRIRTRKGYFSPDDKAAEEKTREEARIAQKAKEDPTDKAVKAAKEKEIRAGLTSLFPVKDIPIELAADFVDVANDGSVAIITAHIEAANLSFVPGKDAQQKDTQQTALDVVTLVFDEKGKIAANISERVLLNLKQPLLEAVRRSGFTYRKVVTVKPGFHQVRFAVREDATARVGSASRWVEIPDLSARKLHLSSLLLTTSLKDLETAMHSGYEPRPTQALRTFTVGSSVDFLVFVYFAELQNGQPDVVLQTQVFSGSKLIHSTPLNRVPFEGAPDLKRLPYAARLSLTDFTPGDYELRVVVIDRVTKQTTDRRANFSVK